MNSYLDIFLIMDWYWKLHLCEISIFFALLTVFLYKYVYKGLIGEAHIKNLNLFIVCFIIVFILTFQNKNYVSAIFACCSNGLEGITKDAKLAWRSEFCYAVNRHTTTLSGCVLLVFCNFQKKFFN